MSPGADAKRSRSFGSATKTPERRGSAERPRSDAQRPAVRGGRACGAPGTASGDVRAYFAGSSRRSPQDWQIGQVVDGVHPLCDLVKVAGPLTFRGRLEKPT